ncbi:cholesterol transport system auxiliary component [Methylomarinovum tepidoasis]|uniref:Cholesterol transport system auxiliary component n=1 Tax=Methylomarinovum tepidoasis TaxID=2840183 RepID=A0AAU9CAX6_9GAMM|nr:ABC-type transport auxiliary lipoprotein family protein [Methylomarinovum sp. IN45]BCX89670.1 cholesterol transport system auxiliary component [Methylomarinovum sp. IN45]
MLLAGCSLLPQRPQPQRLLSLEAAPLQEMPPVAGEKVLRFDPVTAAASLQGVEILYRREGPEVSHYARHRWLAPPAELLDRAVMETLAPHLPYRAVVRPGMPVEADQRLSITLLRLEQIFAADGRSRVHLALQAVWQDARSGRILGSRLFRYHQPARPTAEGAAIAAGQALERFFRDLRAWLENHSSSHTSAPPSGVAYQ